MYGVTNRGEVFDIDSDEVVWDDRVKLYMVRRYGFVKFLRPRYKKKIYALPLSLWIKGGIALKKFYDEWMNQ